MTVETLDRVLSQHDDAGTGQSGNTWRNRPERTASDATISGQLRDPEVVAP